MTAVIPRLMLVTDRRAVGGGDLARVAGLAASGGVDAVQVREKDLPDDDLAALVQRVRLAVRDRAAVLVNGRPSVARRLGVGLHLPEDAPTPSQGGLPLWGRSVHSPEEGLRRAQEAPDYLLLGTVFPTDSKPGHPGGGLALVEAATRAVSPLPVLAIGGVDASNAGAAVAAGAHGVAVRGAILRAADPQAAARTIYAAVTQGEG